MEKSLHSIFLLSDGCAYELRPSQTRGQCARGRRFHHLSPTILENIENLRPELLPLLTAKTQGEMGQVLDHPTALAPKLLYIEDL